MLMSAHDIRTPAHSDFLAMKIVDLIKNCAHHHAQHRDRPRRARNHVAIPAWISQPPQQYAKSRYAISYLTYVAGSEMSRAAVFLVHPELCQAL